MKTTYHKANTRGHANHGWLQSYHSFSFANYYNPERMNFGALRVLNDDIVQPKMGFGKHPHQNMEIISIPLQGALSHKDSMGNKRAITVGEVQVMSAGTGLQHSEFNDSKTEEVNFLQLWIIPEANEVTPYYDQKEFDTTLRNNNFQFVVAPREKIIGDALGIHQQAYLALGNFDENSTHTYKVQQEGNGVYVFVLQGEITINNQKLSKRDALGIENVSEVNFTTNADTELLIVEVPML